jgi:E3 ubiquitin-protein ligase listerin
MHEIIHMPGFFYHHFQPSSSGRAAELLGAQIPAFVGFTAVENYTGFMPVVPGFVTAESINDEDSTLDENYQMILKKMTKKDPTTKVKALQEFVELVAQADAIVFKALLPFWPRLYSNLATDVDHRVREMSQKAHSSVVIKAGKSIGKYLRLLGPAWISSQYDTYAPAASAATQSFQKAFPAAKLKDVFMFCENEILEYFVRNLTQHTAQTLCNPK